VFVKICGTTSEDDALLAVAMGADAVGFIFAPSPRQMSLDKVRDIVRRLPSDVLSVGVFRNEMASRVVKMISEARLGAAQLHGHESPEDTAWVAERVPVTIKVFPPGHEGLQHLGAYGADMVMIDNERPGSGEVFDWSLAEGAPLAGHRLILAGGLNAGNVAGAIRRVQPWGVDVASGVESRPGRKDPTRLRAFVEAAKAARSKRADVGPCAGAEPPQAAGAGPYDWEQDL
jgi:phosphoribosylanthranilate isomerase